VRGFVTAGPLRRVTPAKSSRAPSDESNPFRSSRNAQKLIHIDGLPITRRKPAGQPTLRGDTYDSGALTMLTGGGAGAASSILYAIVTSHYVGSRNGRPLGGTMMIWRAPFVFGS
jgi:hypothetical protein